MKFGSVPLDRAEGAILAHATSAGTIRFRKAHRLVADDIEALRAAGVREVIAAVLAEDDLDENEAAGRIVRAMRFSGMEARPPSTGRINLHAAASGVFTVDKKAVDAINAVDPAVTLATLADRAAVEDGQMVATVKIIPFAVSRAVIDSVDRICRGGEMFRVAPFRPSRVGVIQTELSTVKASVLDKTIRVTEERLSRSGSRLVRERRTAHDAAAVAQLLGPMNGDCDIVLIFGASAMSDFDDVIPSAIRRAGGTVIRAGMPVDPGNLIVVGELQGKPVIGAPGCARSPKENGFDWVLDRLLAGIGVTGDDIAGMGVGGLLMEIPTRPQPRELPVPGRRVDVEVILLAAGRSSRMGGPNKLLALFDGKPLVRRTAERARRSLARRTIVVAGHQAERVRGALDGLDVTIVDNRDFASGLASSLKAGMAAVSPSAAGVMIVLGDMPAVSEHDIDRMIETFGADGGRSIVRAAFAGRRGNPVILPRALFASVGRLEGDTGARHLVEAAEANVIDVDIGEGAFLDVDTPDAMLDAGGVLQD